MRIAVLGTGGVGGYYGALLAHRQHDVTFIARGAHLQAMQDRGLEVKSTSGDFRVRPVRATDRPAEVGPVEIILFCTKTYDTEAAAEQALPMIDKDTTVLSLQNGVDAAERIGKIAGMEHMIAGATWISSAVEAAGVIRHISEFRRVAVGELSGEITARVRSVQEAFKETGVTIDVSENILGLLWTKFIFIAAASGFGSVTRLPIGDFRSIPETRQQIRRLMQEAEAVALALKVRLPRDAVEIFAGVHG